MRNLISLVCALMILAACHNTSQPQQSAKPKSVSEQLDSQIMTLHDDAMPYISTVLRLRKAIQLHIDSFPNSPQSDSLKKITYALTKADKDMMDWMHQYHAPDTLSEMDREQYFNQQLPLIQAVHAGVHGSILQANEKGFH